jgi:hypothetical protein
VFINPDAPRHPAGLAYTCAACPDNARTYNDGYHATHHANSRTHWSELPARWAATLEEQDELDGEGGGEGGGGGARGVYLVGGRRGRLGKMRRDDTGHGGCW